MRKNPKKLPKDLQAIRDQAERTIALILRARKQRKKNGVS
jgi:hypothetical protein